MIRPALRACPTLGAPAHQRQLWLAQQAPAPQAPAPQAPTLTPILAGKKFVSRSGRSQVDYTSEHEA